MGLTYVAGCTSAKPAESNDERNASQYCEEPENPYTEGTGHYAGYEWAESHDSGTCNGSSDSFNEGCEEYETQEAEYQECETQKKDQSDAFRYHSPSGLGTP